MSHHNEVAWMKKFDKAPIFEDLLRTVPKYQALSSLRARVSDGPITNEPDTEHSEESHSLSRGEPTLDEDWTPGGSRGHQSAGGPYQKSASQRHLPDRGGQRFSELDRCQLIAHVAKFEPGSNIDWSGIDGVVSRSSSNNPVCRLKCFHM
jgi:hypothetical protein